MLGPTCRAQFTADDFQFVVRTLARDRESSVGLVELLSDESARDQVLDHELLYRELLESGRCLSVSPSLYFYVLTRHVMRKAGMSERELADYIAAVLVNFANRTHLHLQQGGEVDPRGHPYITDLMKSLAEASPQQAVFIRVHTANYALFLSGIFADRIRARCERRGGPDLTFYERVGQSNYSVAAKHRLVQEFNLERTFQHLAERFHDVRCALNYLADDLLHLSPPPPEASGGLIGPA
jgi:hypothetical protein